MNKISYKTYFNDRLKQVDFHGKTTHPLYVMVTYGRQTIYFKSYYFALFSKPRFLLDVPGVGVKGPDLELAVKKENEVISFIINKHRNNFSLETFKAAYAYYSVDLCDLSEKGFRDYLFNFFWDDGSPFLGDLVKHGGPHIVAYDLMRDFKRNFEKARYDKLVKSAFSYAPPYLPLYGFMAERKCWPELCLTMMEWQSIEVTLAFKAYLERLYPNIDGLALVKEVNELPYSKWS
jgi:hypothetical protein